MRINEKNLVDRAGYNEYYRSKPNYYLDCENCEEFAARFQASELTPFWAGGGTKGFVRGECVRALVRAIRASTVLPQDLRILDAGCGLGGLSVYLGCKGYTVIGIDISEEACRSATLLGEKIGVSDRVKFETASLEHMPTIDSQSIDFVIGHASLHHFIKYNGVPAEFRRILKPGGKGFFADSFGENKLYHLFHNKEKMERLGDVILTRRRISKYFKDFELEIMPTDWFVMLDKLWLKFLASNADQVVRRFSRIHFLLDRIIPSNKIFLTLAGAILTTISKPLEVNQRAPALSMRDGTSQSPSRPRTRHHLAAVSGSACTALGRPAVEPYTGARPQMALRCDGLAASPASPRLPRTTHLRFALRGAQR